MSPLPQSELSARRAAARARRKRRRVALSVVAVLIVAAVVAVAALGSGGSSHKVASRTPPLPAKLPPPAHVSASSSLAALDAAGRAEIARLARYALPVYCGGTHGNEVAFTFDDGPGVYTHYAVKKMTQAHERATFFVVGKSMNAWPGWLPRERTFAAIGDHTWTHPVLPALPPAEIRSELEMTKEKIQRDSGEVPDLFRPPYGAYDGTVISIARSLGLLTIMWTVDSRDSLGADWLGIIHNVEAAAVHPGAIILMHENRGQTIRALTTILPFLARHHIRSVSLPELFATDPPTVAQLRRGLYGCPGFSVGGNGS